MPFWLMRLVLRSVSQVFLLTEEPEYTRDEGYFVNIRLLDDGFDD